jgi:N-acetylglucosamine-6-phosphate deacetylase
VHSPSAIRPLEDKDIALYQRLDDEILLITLAPETVLADAIQSLSQQAIVSLGHTNASPEQIRAALATGASGFTHLYNAMGAMSAREPSVAGAALDDRHSWCGLIADGHHVAPEMIRLALRAKPRGKVFLVSDAMPPAATETPQPFHLYGELIQIESTTPSQASSRPRVAARGRLQSGSSGTCCGNCKEDHSHCSKGDSVWIPASAGMTHEGSGILYPKCVTSAGGLAGSAITLLDAVRYCVQHVGVDLDEALRMGSTYPAAFLGVEKTLGKLLPGYRADVIGLSQNLELYKPKNDSTRRSCLQRG